MIGRETETVIICGYIYDRTGNGKSNIVEVYPIGKARETIILWGYI